MLQADYLNVRVTVDHYVRIRIRNDVQVVLLPDAVRTPLQMKTLNAVLSLSHLESWIL